MWASFNNIILIFIVWSFSKKKSKSSTRCIIDRHVVIEHCFNIFIPCHMVIESAPSLHQIHPIHALLKLPNNYIYSLSTSVFEDGWRFILCSSCWANKSILIQLFSLTRPTIPYHDVLAWTRCVSSPDIHCLVMPVRSLPGLPWVSLMYIS